MKLLGLAEYRVETQTQSLAKLLRVFIDYGSVMCIISQSVRSLSDVRLFATP